MRATWFFHVKIRLQLINLNIMSEEKKGGCGGACGCAGGEKKEEKKPEGGCGCGGGQCGK